MRISDGSSDVCSSDLARPTRGTESSIARITVEDLRGVVAQRFGRDRLFVGVVGDITPDALGKVLDDTFLALTEKAEPFEIGKAKVQNKGETVVNAKPITQSVVALGQEGIARQHHAYYAAYVDRNSVVNGKRIAQSVELGERRKNKQK